MVLIKRPAVKSVHRDMALIGAMVIARGILDFLAVVYTGTVLRMRTRSGVERTGQQLVLIALRAMAGPGVMVIACGMVARTNAFHMLILDSIFPLMHATLNVNIRRTQIPA